MTSCSITGNTASGSVRAHVQKLPIAPMGKCLTLMGFSHASCVVLSGWRCLCLWRHGDLLIMHHHWQHSFLCACSYPQNFPSPRWEKCSRACFDSRLHNCGQRFCRLQYVRAAEDLENFLSPRWENALMTCPTESSGLSLLGFAIVTSDVISRSLFPIPRGQMSL